MSVRWRLRVAGWALLGAGVVLVAAVVVMGAWLAHSSDEFNRWVGWANVWGLVVGAVGVALVAMDKVAGGSARRELGVAEAEEELAAVVLAQGRVARSRLLGVDEAGDQAANVRFVRGAGRFHEVGGAGEGDLGSVLAYYRSLSPGRLVVLGEAGAGKTVLALELVIRLLEQRKRDGGGPVPVVISAAAWETGQVFEEWLAAHLAGRFRMGVGVAGRLVRDRRVIPVVDGLDEMDPTEGSPERARAAVRALNSYMAGLERAAVVVTCRRAEYAGVGVAVDRATHMEMVPLDSGEATGYLLDQLRDEEELTRWEPVLAELERDPDGPVAAQLATPWRLVLALTVFRDGGDPAELLPDPARDERDPADAGAEGYMLRVERLLLSRYVPAMVRLHDPGGRYRVEMVQRWLTGLATGLDWQARHGRSATDIELAHWWRPLGERTTRLLHMVVAAIPLMAFIVFSALTQGHGVAFGIFLGTLVAAAEAFSPGAEHINLRRLSTPHGRREFLGVLVNMLVGTLILGLLFGLLLGLLFGLLVGILVGLGAGLLVGLSVGLGVGLVVGIMGGLDDPSPGVVSPKDLIRAIGRFGLVLGLLFGLVLGLLFGLLAGLGLGLVVGLGNGNVWVRYHLAVVVAASRGLAPLRFGAFLDWAYGAGLLRVSGVAYQFRHRQLQDWLSSCR